MKSLIKTKNSGYAILFTVVVVGIISMISMGLSNTAYKQMILSSVARDSTVAFFEADIGSDCALYADDSGALLTLTNFSNWVCGGKTLVFTKVVNSSVTTYNFNPQDESSSDKCFRVEIIKTVGSDAIATSVSSKGYNICNKSNLRTVERAIKITY